MSILRWGPVRQVGYIVRDIEKAMKDWIHIGVGPWFGLEKIPVTNFQYMGKPSAMSMSAAVTFAGYIEIELISPTNDAPSLYRDFLGSGREGIQHISHWVGLDEFDVKSKMLFERGYIIGQSGEIGENSRFAYFIQPNDKQPGTIIEMSEMDESKEAFMKQLADICANWDASDPIRYTKATDAGAKMWRLDALSDLKQ